MSLATQLHDQLCNYATRNAGQTPAVLAVTALDAWQLRAECSHDHGSYLLRNLVESDVPALQSFAAALGPRSRYFFGPYPWDTPEKLDDAFQAAIAQALGRIDASYLLFDGQQPIGHFFLWKAMGNPLAAPYGIRVPELGIALVDAVQGRGLGGLIMRLLEAVAISLEVDAIELTTAQDNENGYRTYSRAGYIELGLLRIPLNVDVTAAEAGEVCATTFRDERHMVRILNPDRETDVLCYLAAKRAAATPSVVDSSC